MMRGQVATTTQEVIRTETASRPAPPEKKERKGIQGIFETKSALNNFKAP